MRFLQFLLSLLFTATLASGELHSDKLRLATFNIRMGGVDQGDRAWPERKELVAETIRKMNPDLLGMQEAFDYQIKDLLKSLPDYTSIGVGRDDGKNAGEFSPILYRKKQFELLDSGTFWLSDTPQVPGSITWGNNCTRVCTWAKMKRKSTGKELVLFNTHWDHRGQESRVKSADLMLKWVKKHPESQVIMMGDFNATETNPAIHKLTTAGFTNCFLSLHQAEKNRGTHHPWTGKGSAAGTIDHIFVSPKPTIQKSWIERHHKGTQWPSDHFPVSAVIH